MRNVRIVDRYFPLLAADARAKLALREAGVESGARGESRGFADWACAIFSWALDHQGAACAALAATVVAICVAGDLVSPAEAAAFPLIPIIIGVSAVGLFFAGGDIAQGVATTVEDGLRGAVNFELATVTSSISSFLNGNLLTQDFGTVMPEVVEVLKGIHGTVAVPAANVVLIVFLLVGLGKVISDMNRSETGVDLWRLIMVFIGFAFAKTVVDGSWALMECAFDIVQWVIKGIAANPYTEMTYSAGMVPDEITHWGILLMMLLVAFLVKLVVLLVIVLANVTVLVRIIQIYVYICLAPLPLATLVSDGSSNVATHFLKAFCAVLVSGAILAVLFVMMSALVSTLTATTTAVDPGSIDSAIQWVIELFFSIAAFLAFGWCVFQSGTWARDFTGV